MRISDFLSRQGVLGGGIGVGHCVFNSQGDGYLVAYRVLNWWVNKKNITEVPICYKFIALPSLALSWSSPVDDRCAEAFWSSEAF